MNYLCSWRPVRGHFVERNAYDQFWNTNIEGVSDLSFDTGNEAFSQANLSSRYFASVCVSLMIQSGRTLKQCFWEGSFKRFPNLSRFRSSVLHTLGHFTFSSICLFLHNHAMDIPLTLSAFIFRVKSWFYTNKICCAFFRDVYFSIRRDDYVHRVPIPLDFSKSPNWIFWTASVV
jgi:hypothetical protein